MRYAHDRQDTQRENARHVTIFFFFFLHVADDNAYYVTCVYESEDFYFFRTRVADVQKQL